MIGRNVFSTHEYVISLILLAVNSCEWQKYLTDHNIYLMTEWEVRAS